MPSEDELQAIFKSFDTSGDGKIDQSELLAALTKAGKKATQDEVDKLLKQVDQNSDNQLDFSEFKKIFELAPEEAKALGDWGIFSFLQPQPPAAAPAAPPAAPVEDISDPTPAAPAAEPASPVLNLTAEQIEAFEPQAVVDTLIAAVESSPEKNVVIVEVCCKRLRVLCREPDNCKKCDQAGTAQAVVKAMGTAPYDTQANVQLQALASLVNLCSGEANEFRQNAVQQGAMKAVAAAMAALPDSAEVQEMACIALQNCCYGEDDNAVERRKAAGEAGAIELVINAMKSHVDSSPMQEVGSATLRLMVHRVKDLKDRALKGGAAEEWVKPIREGGGILSFRKVGFGTSRRNKGKN